MRRFRLILFLLLLGTASHAAPKKIVLLSGEIDGGHPKGTHEYVKDLRLLKHWLETSPNLSEVHVEQHLGGWPKEDSTLEDADAIVLFSNGGDIRAEDHPFLVGDRHETIQRQMDRGCGLVVLHWSTIVPNEPLGSKFLDWIGGYFDCQSDPTHPRGWYSQITLEETTTDIPSPDHPISRGLTPFRLNEEYYYRIRFREDDPRLMPILDTPITGAEELQTVAWAVEREDGGRGFGFTGGHFSSNLFIEGYRKLLLNAIVWTAGMEVPAEGVQAKEPDPIRALIVTGHNFPGHDWKGVTEALMSALDPDPRLYVESTDNIQDLADPKIHKYDVLLFNYVNWQRPGLSQEARDNFKKYVEEGGGLVLVHFANGAFNYSLPEAADSDWPEYRTRIVRRAWIHGEGGSAHDPYGKFLCEIADPDHPITQGMKNFETEDELYYNQIGDLPIHPLVTALSKDTGKQEPLAFAYDYGAGRIFQSFLGHAPISISAPGPAELFRRGTVWAADRLQIDLPAGE